MRKVCCRRSLVVLCIVITASGFSDGLAVAAATQQSLSQGDSSEMISPEEFTNSPFAAFFREGDYEQALEALKPLLERYPHDPLVRRYQAMTLDRLGRSEEAIAIYQELLTTSPDHVPTRFFLGQAYERAGDRKRASEEWRWVAQQSLVKEYRQWAEKALSRVGTAAAAGLRRKAWTLVGDLGWDWDSNVTLKPDDKALAAGGDQNAGRFSINLGLRYRAFERRDRLVEVLYTSRQSLHDDSLDDFNFTSQEFGLDAQQRTTVGGREMLFRGRYELSGGFLESDLFSLSNRFFVSDEVRLTPHTRTILSNRLTVSNFGPDGSNPPQTSRDGLYDDIALTHYLYAKDFRRYLFLRQGYAAGWTRGGNFDRRGTTTRAGLHTPLAWRTDLDCSGGFEFNAYPHFTSLSSLDTNRRRDTNWDLGVFLTHHLNPQLDVELGYRWITARNRNDFFQYDRHIAGIHVLFSQSF